MERKWEKEERKLLGGGEGLTIGEEEKSWMITSGTWSSEGILRETGQVTSSRGTSSKSESGEGWERSDQETTGGLVEVGQGTFSFWLGADTVG